MKRNLRRVYIWIALSALELVALNLPYINRLSRLLVRLTIASEAES